MAEKRGRGRPTKYEDAYSSQAEKLAEAGWTVPEMANFFEVGASTVHRWFLDHPEFREAATRGREQCDERVERSLYQRAVGYEFRSEKVAINAQGEVTRAATVEHVPPEPGAALNWLKNRRPAAWRDKQEIEHSGEIAAPTAKDRARALAALMAKQKTQG